ncbi:serine/threonine-protein kinase csk1 [Poronia punctata]|nr:serine/threonine-protein kinase csk1 [Poronia punctata]
MTSEADWRRKLASSERYDNIQTLKSKLEQTGITPADAQSEAFSLENKAYKESKSQDDYIAACRSAAQDNLPSTTQERAVGSDENNPSNSHTITIGPYHNCHYIADGVTAEVYRSATTALKVIVQTRNIEPHDPYREAKILKLLKKPCIPLLETFRDQEQRFVLAFPYMPLSLESLLEKGGLSKPRIISHFRDLFTALQSLHEEGIIHRDIKPSALLLQSPDGPAFVSDFGTAWHPRLSTSTEPGDLKILDIGTGPYRSPEALFGDRSYGPAVDMWAAGAMMAECCRTPTKPLFESRPAHEDGNQLGLILSIFKTIGSPTPESWPEAVALKTPPFEMYQTFEGHTWEYLLPGVEEGFRSLIASLVKYSSSARASAKQPMEPTVPRHLLAWSLASFRTPVQQREIVAPITVCVSSADGNCNRHV